MSMLRSVHLETYKHIDNYGEQYDDPCPDITIHLASSGFGRDLIHIGVEGTDWSTGNMVDIRFNLHPDQIKPMVEKLMNLITWYEQEGP